MQAHDAGFFLLNPVDRLLPWRAVALAKVAEDDGRKNRGRRKMYAALIASLFPRERVRVRVFAAVKAQPVQSPHLNPLLFQKRRGNGSA
jgi:hypothetical protein